MKGMFYRTLLVILSSALGASSFAFALSYDVKPGESLSVIAHRVIPGPVWGKSGSLKKILASNPEYQSNPDHILSGSLVVLSDNSEPSRRQPASEPSAAPVSQPILTLATPVTLPVILEKPTGQYSLVSIAPFTSFSRINSTDLGTGAHAVLGSGLNFGAELGWHQYWSKNFQTALSFSGESTHFTSPASSHALDHSNQFLGKIDFEGDVGEQESTQTIFHLGIVQAPFLLGDSGSALLIDSSSVPFIGVGLALPLYHSDVFRFKSRVTADFLSPITEGDYQIKSGFAATAEFSLEQFSTSSNKRLSESLIFRYSNQNTSLTKQSEEELGAQIKWSFDFFEGHP